MDSCAYNWARDRKMGSSMTANAVKSVTAHEVINKIIVYPDNVLNIVWNYQDDLEKLLLDIGMGRQDGKDTDL